MTETEATFAALGLRESLVRTLTSLGYEAPTPIQERTIPVLLAGRDVIGQAQTGTGKTAAFALPILERIDPELRDTQALVLAPTRELAMQVAEALHSYAHLMRSITVLPVYGGAPIVHQLKRLERGVQIVVGTPGRLIDHLDRKSLRLDKIRMVVLDEADEMLKMGFIDDVERILGDVPKPRQIALFSATMPPEIVRIAQRHLTNPEHIEIEHKSISAPGIEQRFINVSESQKLETLTNVLELEEHPAVLIFRRTKNGAAELAERLEGRGFAAEAMHGDMNQAQRESVIRRLKSGNIEIVVATDVAARGLDVEQISHVVNYDIPHDVEAYVHRIGRTGRAGRSGVATLFMTPRERRMMREIERFTGTAIKPMKLPSRADVAARRAGQLKETIRKTIEQGELDLYVELVEQMVEEGQHDLAEIAAAAARLASVGRPIAAESESAAPSPEPRADAPRREPRREAGAESRPRPSRPPESADRPRHDAAGAEGKVRISMAVGKNDGIRPADVVGSIANEADVPGRDIGPIEILDDITYVTIPAAVLEQVMTRVGRAKFRGRPVNLKLAGPGEERSFAPRRREDDRPRPEKRSFTPRARDDERPPAGKRSFVPRGRDDDRPRTASRSFTPRSRDDERPPAGKRTFAPRGRDDDRPRTASRSFAPRRDNERPPAGKRSFAPRRTDDRPKSFGPRTGERRPFERDARPKGGAFSGFAGKKRSGPPKGKKR